MKHIFEIDIVYPLENASALIFQMVTVTFDIIFEFLGSQQPKKCVTCILLLTPYLSYNEKCFKDAFKDLVKQPLIRGSARGNGRSENPRGQTERKF